MGLSDFLSKLSKGIQAVAPNLQQVGENIVSAAGSPQQQQSLEQNRELALRKQQLGMQQQLQQAQIQNENLRTALGQKQLENYQTPQQASDLELSRQRALLESQRETAPPTDVVAPLEGGGYGHYTRAFDKKTGTYQTTPTMIDQERANPAAAPGAVAPPSVIGNLVPPSPTVHTRQQLAATPPNAILQGAMPVPFGPPVWDEATGQYVQNFRPKNGTSALPPTSLSGTPISALPSTTTKPSIQKDQNNNLVSIPTTTVTRKGAGGPTAANQGRATLGSGTGAAQPVLDSQGNQLHAPLGADAKKNIRQIGSTEAVMNTLVPEIDARIAQLGGDANGLWDMAQQRAAWAEYQAGKSPTNIDPTLAKILPTVAQLQIIGGLPYMQGTRSYQYLQQIQQHLPNPEKDTPEQMANKLHTVATTLPLLRQATLDAEGVGTGVQGKGGPPPLPGSAPKIGQVKKFPNGKTGVWDGTGYVAQ